MSERITLEDNKMSAIIKMVDGNPGAMDAVMDLMNKSPEIDPQSAFGELGPLLSLDSHGIYGTDIYILYNDKCGSDARKMLMLLRSVQLGFLPESKLQEMAGDQMRKVDLTADEWASLDRKVCEELDGFEKKETGR